MTRAHAGSVHIHGHAYIHTGSPSSVHIHGHAYIHTGSRKLRAYTWSCIHTHGLTQAPCCRSSDALPTLFRREGAVCVMPCSTVVLDCCARLLCSTVVLDCRARLSSPLSGDVSVGGTPTHLLRLRMGSEGRQALMGSRRSHPLPPLPPSVHTPPCHLLAAGSPRGDCNLIADLLEEIAISSLLSRGRSQSRRRQLSQRRLAAHDGPACAAVPTCVYCVAG